MTLLQSSFTSGSSVDAKVQARAHSSRPGCTSSRHCDVVPQRSDAALWQRDVTPWLVTSRCKCVTSVVGVYQAACSAGHSRSQPKRAESKVAAGHSPSVRDTRSQQVISPGVRDIRRSRPQRERARRSELDPISGAEFDNSRRESDWSARTQGRSLHTSACNATVDVLVGTFYENVN